jgi:transcriptional regulator with XRE-family HTH domain
LIVNTFDGGAHRHVPANLRHVSFGRTVRSRRKALGLTLEKLAERAELSPNYLGTIETGRRDPSLSTIEKIAGALGTVAGELLGGAKGLSAQGLEAGRLFDQSSSDVQESLLPLLRTLSRRRR